VAEVANAAIADPARELGVKAHSRQPCRQWGVTTSHRSHDGAHQSPPGSTPAPHGQRRQSGTDVAGATPRGLRLRRRQRRTLIPSEERTSSPAATTVIGARAPTLQLECGRRAARQSRLRGAPSPVSRRVRAARPTLSGQPGRQHLGELVEGSEPVAVDLTVRPVAQEAHRVAPAEVVLELSGPRSPWPGTALLAVGRSSTGRPPAAVPARSQDVPATCPRRRRGSRVCRTLAGRCCDVSTSTSTSTYE
jgi:hypothetical protein